MAETSRSGADSSVDAAGRPAHEPTMRALVVGAVVGVVLAAANVYTALKTTFIDAGTITASLCGFALLTVLSRRGRAPHVLETNVIQTTAASASIAVVGVGIAGPLPAMQMLGHELGTLSILAWGLGLGIVGVALAAILRRPLVVVENLPFPSGTATARIVEATHESRSQSLRRAAVLALATLAAMAWTLLRDGPPAWIPQGIPVSITVAGVALSTLGFSISCSPLLFSTGMFVGLRNAASMGLGALLAWGLATPMLASQGAIESTEYTAALSWLMWPAVGLMVFGSLVALLPHLPAARRAFGDVMRLRGTGKREHTALVWSLLGAGTLLVVAVSWWSFSMPLWFSLTSVVAALVLAGVCARAAGETDVAPVGSIGTLTQLTMGSGGTLHSLATGGTSCGIASHTAQGLWTYKTGHLLGAGPRSQLVAQLLGVFVGTLVVIPVYDVVVGAYGLGTEALPAPAAIAWRATAEAVQGATLPSGAPLAAALAAVLGSLLALPKLAGKRFSPSPVALAIGVVCPASVSMTILLGALVFWALGRKFPTWSDDHLPTLAAGGIAGESLMGVSLAIAVSLGLI